VDAELFYTTQEVAALYGVQSEETVRRWAKTVRIPAVQVADHGGSWRYPKAWVDADLAGQGSRS
jgi:excisionase family DNA binding protein